jgi:hypothetical protein
MNNINKIIASLAAIITLSCNKPDCQSNNPVFNSNLPDSPAYRSEMAKQLQANNDNLSYWLNGYLETKSDTYLVIEIVGDNLCAEGHMLVKNWDKDIQDIQRTKGMGYIGAEFKGLKYAISSDGTLVYKSLDRIID